MALIDLNVLGTELEAEGIYTSMIEGYVLTVEADFPGEDDDESYLIEIRSDDGIRIDPPWDYIDEARWRFLNIVNRHRVMAGFTEDSADA